MKSQRSNFELKLNLNSFPQKKKGNDFDEKIIFHYLTSQNPNLTLSTISHFQNGSALLGPLMTGR